MKTIQLATREEARAILGRDFHGPEKNIDSGWIIPWTKEILEKAKGNYILIYGRELDDRGEKMTINWFRKKFPEGSKPGFMRQYGEPINHFPFSKDFTCEERYYLLPKKIPLQHPSRNAKPIKLKMADIGDYEQIEPAIVYIFATFLHYSATKEILYPYDYVLTTDKVGESVVRVGHFKYKDIYVGLAQPGMIYNMLGVAPRIKPLI